jgi:heat shock protein HtpX
MEELMVLASMALVLALIAWLLAGAAGLVAVSTVMVAASVLRPRIPAMWIMRMCHGQPLPRWVAPELHETVDWLSARAHLERRPALFYIPSRLPNAFVVGDQRQPVLAVTDGLLRLLDERQLAGVVAHELSHLRNGDTSTMNVSDLVAGLARWMGRIGLWSVLVAVPVAVIRGSLVPVLLSLLLLTVPVVVTFTQLALFRSWEYEADLEAARLTGDPEGLARALIALESSDARVWEYILTGPSPGEEPLILQTHPPTEQRIRRLRELPRR